MASQALHDIADEFQNAWQHVRTISNQFDAKFIAALKKLRDHAEADGEQVLADAETAGKTLAGQAVVDAGPVIADLEAGARDLVATAEQAVTGDAAAPPAPEPADGDAAASADEQSAPSDPQPAA